MAQRIVTTEFRVERIRGKTPWKRWLSYAPTFDNNAYHLDRVAVESACSKLDIPIIPSIFSGSNGLGATWWNKWSGALMYVTVDTKLSMEHASVVLWHELGHVLQFHRDNHFPKRPINASNGWEPYWNEPTEVEAREIERYGLQYPLYTDEPDMTGISAWYKFGNPCE